MKTRNNYWIILVVLALVSAACGTTPGSQSDSLPETLTAVFTHFEGTVQVLLESDGMLVNAEVGQNLEEGDQVFTHRDSTATITLSSGTVVRMVPQTSFTLQQHEPSPDTPYTRLSLAVGEIWIILQGGSLDVDTPSGLASVRGSYMSVHTHLGQSKVTVTCLEGHCTVTNKGGEMKMIAGQKAEMVDEGTLPSMGFMNESDAARWMFYNPEASAMMPQLTATIESMMEESGPKSCPIPPGWAPVILGAGDNLNAVANRYGLPAEELAQGNCMAESVEVKEGDIIFAPELPTATPTAVDCGPPDGWVIYLTQDGDTLESLSAAYRVSITDLQKAACLGDSTTIVAGLPLFVPNVPTTTPVPTRTPRPTSTNTSPPPAATNTPAPTAIPTATTDPNTSFSAAGGPQSGAIATCSNTYTIDAVDIDGISFVKVEYSLNGAGFPGTTVLLTNAGGNTWSGTFSISTSAIVGTDTVEWRYIGVDSLNNYAYFPATGGFAYTDALDCP